MAPPPLRTWKVLSRKELARDVFELRVARPGDLHFRAGQYISVVIPGAGPGGRNLRRAYSIASAPHWPELELCVKRVESGPGTNYLDTLGPGDEFEGQAPFGTFCLEHDQQTAALFIGTGTGLAPLRSMVLSDEWTSTAPTGFLLGVRSQQDIVYPEMFGPDRPPQLKNHEHVRIALSRPEGDWSGFQGRVTDYIRAMDWDFAKSHYYVCGSGDMIAEVKDYLITAKGVDKQRIHTEKYF